jgi:hypothetical protein
VFGKTGKREGFHDGNCGKDEFDMASAAIGGPPPRSRGAEPISRLFAASQPGSSRGFDALPENRPVTFRHLSASDERRRRKADARANAQCPRPDSVAAALAKPAAAG